MAKLFATKYAWNGIINRCERKSVPQYKYYGGRGIKMCLRWRESYETFRIDMGVRPSLKHSIDRINNDGDYEPSNCRWATPVEQASNKRPRLKQDKIYLRGIRSWVKMDIYMKRLNAEISRIKSTGPILNDSQRLLIDILEAAIASKMTPSSLCMLTIRNGNLPDRLRAGCQVRPSTAKKLRAKLVAEVIKRREDMQ